MSMVFVCFKPASAESGDMCALRNPVAVSTETLSFNSSSATQIAVRICVAINLAQTLLISFADTDILWREERGYVLNRVACVGIERRLIECNYRTGPQERDCRYKATVKCNTRTRMFL